MLKWVARRGLDGRAISACGLCADGADAAAHPHLRTIEEHIAWLVGSKEIVESDGAVRPVFEHGTLVGYIELTDNPPAHTSDVGCRVAEHSRAHKHT